MGHRYFRSAKKDRKTSGICFVVWNFQEVLLARASLIDHVPLPEKTNKQIEEHCKLSISVERPVLIYIKINQVEFIYVKFKVRLYFSARKLYDFHPSKLNCIQMLSQCVNNAFGQEKIRAYELRDYHAKVSVNIYQ